MCLMGIHTLTHSRPTLTIVVIQSDLSYCHIFISAYFLYILFLPILFTSLNAFMYSLLSDDLCWLSIGYSLLDALFIIWLFLCLVVLRMSVFYIANWLLFVWICVRKYNLAVYHFHIILHNWYISVIFPEVPIRLFRFCHPYILHCRMFVLTIYHRYFVKIFVNFM